MRRVAAASIALLLAACGGEDAPGAPGGAPSAPGPATADARAAFLSGWASPDGSDLDPSTGYPKRVRREKDAAVMVLVPGGTFSMGAVDGDANAFDTEKPRREVTLSRAYYLDEHEVTNAQWKAFSDSTAYRTLSEKEGTGFVADEDGRFAETEGATWRAPLPGGTRPTEMAKHPVVLVTWGDAKAFAAWAGVALPTEAQFERAIRGGHAGRVFPWGDGLPAPKGTGNFADESARRSFPGWSRTMPGYDDGFPRTAPVASFSANEYGCFDLSGNVWEWCADAFAIDAYGTGPARDPAGPRIGSAHVMRGGAWSHDPLGLRVSDRTPAENSYRDGCGGFRCAKSTP